MTDRLVIWWLHWRLCQHDLSLHKTCWLRVHGLVIRSDHQSLRSFLLLNLNILLLRLLTLFDISYLHRRLRASIRSKRGFLLRSFVKFFLHNWLFLLMVLGGYNLLLCVLSGSVHAIEISKIWSINSNFVFLHYPMTALFRCACITH